MAKECNDFTYANKKLSDFGYTARISFDGSEDLPLGLSREIEKGETNKYRKEANQTGVKYSNDGLQFEIDIMKDPCVHTTQAEMEITRENKRLITRWLSSPHLNSQLECIDDPSSDENLLYFGLFTNIENYIIGGRVYGLKLTFTCSTPYAYTPDIIHRLSVAGDQTLILLNNDDEMSDYVYPSLSIKANQTGQVFICNLTDSIILDEGSLYPTDIGTGEIDILKSKIIKYAVSKGYETIYSYNSDGTTVKTICDNSAIQFIYKDSQDIERKCTAFKLSNGDYKIIEGGFLYLTANKSLPITIDFQHLLLFDELGRPIYFSNIGVDDVDQVYWLRLLNGNNTLLFHAANCDFTLKYRECRKVGA